VRVWVFPPRSFSASLAVFILINLPRRYEACLAERLWSRVEGKDWARTQAVDWADEAADWASTLPADAGAGASGGAGGSAGASGGGGTEGGRRLLAVATAALRRAAAAKAATANGTASGGSSRSGGSSGSSRSSGRQRAPTAVLPLAERRPWAPGVWAAASRGEGLGGWFGRWVSGGPMNARLAAEERCEAEAWAAVDLEAPPPPATATAAAATLPRLRASNSSSSVSGGPGSGGGVDMRQHVAKVQLLSHELCCSFLSNAPSLPRITAVAATLNRAFTVLLFAHHLRASMWSS
jgi:hypothetical protein